MCLNEGLGLEEEVFRYRFCIQRFQEGYVPEPERAASGSSGKVHDALDIPTQGSRAHCNHGSMTNEAQHGMKRGRPRSSGNIWSTWVKRLRTSVVHDGCPSDTRSGLG